MTPSKFSIEIYKEFQGNKCTVDCFGLWYGNDLRPLQVGTIADCEKMKKFLIDLNEVTNNDD